MSELKGNPYAEKSAIQPHLTENDGFWGISQTVMALAFEVRTANLLSLFKHVDYQGDLVDHASELFDDIADRLGLRDADA